VFHGDGAGVAEFVEAVDHGCEPRSAKALAEGVRCAPGRRCGSTGLPPGAVTPVRYVELGGLGYPFAIGLMGVVCLSLYVIFKRRIPKVARTPRILPSGAPLIGSEAGWTPVCCGRWCELRGVTVGWSAMRAAGRP
jgi:hypothetical protein